MFSFKYKFHAILKQLFLLSVLSFALLSIIFEIFNLHINVSNSIPIGIYKLEISLPKNNDYALFCMNKEYTKIAKGRNYIANGKCNGTAPLEKRVAATSSNIVKINEFGTFVDNVRLDKSTPFKEDLNGHKLPFKRLSKRLNDNEYLMMSDDLYSFDSRYFGIVQKEMIIGTLRPLITYKQGHIKWPFIRRLKC